VALGVLVGAPCLLAGRWFARKLGWPVCGPRRFGGPPVCLDVLFTVTGYVILWGGGLGVYIGTVYGGGVASLVLALVLSACLGAAVVAREA
jgi:hypothetical protein